VQGGDFAVFAQQKDFFLRERGETMTIEFWESLGPELLVGLVAVIGALALGVHLFHEAPPPVPRPLPPRATPARQPEDPRTVLKAGEWHYRVAPLDAAPLADPELLARARMVGIYDLRADDLLERVESREAEARRLGDLQKKLLL
jgi:hypothetical protein